MLIASRLLHVVAAFIIQNGAGLDFQRHLLQAPVQREFPFRRYLLDFGASASSGCPALVPSITISCGAELVFLDSKGTDCVQQGSSWTCSGTGRVLVDCVARNALVDLLSALAVRARLQAPTESFTCSVPASESIGQGIFIALVCPDGTTDFDKIYCEPITTRVAPPNSNPLCVSSCSGTCTNEDIISFLAEVVDSSSCLWEPGDLTTSLPTTLPTSAPSAPTAPSLDCPTIELLPDETFVEFGLSVALNQDTIVIGARELAYIYVRTENDEWTLQAKVRPSEDGIADAEFWFGRSVAIDGDTIVVGARIPGPDDGSVLTFEDYGSVYVFTRTGNNWTQQARLVIGELGDDFGNSVAIEGDTVVVGARRDFRGAVHVFVREGNSWTQQDKLTVNASRVEEFGESVAISGNTIVVGANDLYGSVYVFTRSSNNTWTQQAELLDRDAAQSNRETLGFSSVDIDGDTIVAGTGIKSNNGSAFVFTRTGDVWTQQARFFGFDDVAGKKNYALSVSIDEDVIAVGAPEDDSTPNATWSGAVYVFTRTENTWALLGMIPYDKSFANFGESVSVEGGLLVAGAPAEGGSASIVELCADGSASPSLAPSFQPSLAPSFQPSSSIIASPAPQELAPSFQPSSGIVASSPAPQELAPTKGPNVNLTEEGATTSASSPHKPCGNFFLTALASIFSLLVL